MKLFLLDPGSFDAEHKHFAVVCKEITGDRWCPYPSHLFMTVVNRIDREIGKALIKERRTFTLPTFLEGDPQQEKLQKLFDEHVRGWGDITR